MIVFKNKGRIDIRAVTTFGVSAKGENKSAIGYFGTGLKYAIAITLRHGGKISVWRGLDKYEFHAVKDTVRDKEFDFVFMDEIRAGEKSFSIPLGFTTHLGANWEPWQAFREIYCNCLDEGGSTSLEAQPEEGYTTVVVDDFPAFQQAWADRHDIVLTDEPRYINDCVDVRLRGSRAIYYRGVRVIGLDKPAVRTYNITQPVQLTEDRTLRYTYQAESAVANSVLRSEDGEYIRMMLTSPADSWEYTIGYQQGHLDVPSEVFLDTVAAIAQNTSVPLAPAALKVLYARREFSHALQPIDMSDQERRQLDFAYALLSRMGYDVKYPVTVVDNLGTGVLGKAYMKEGKIALARRAFEIGTKCVAGTLLEEFLHLAFQYQDESRDFQNFLLDKLISTAISHHMPGELV